MHRDSEVEQQVLRSLRLDSAISSREICLHSHCGVVTLSGTVPSYREWSAIYYASLRSIGVCGVVNSIQVSGDRRRTPEQSWSETRSFEPPNALSITSSNSR
jgi:osmotically-inducible protein OsmY